MLGFIKKTKRKENWNPEGAKNIRFKGNEA